MATTVYRFREGRYKFVTVSDDGVRVYVDDELIIDNWTHHAATTDARTVRLSGEHRVTVRYCQDGGGSAFSLDWFRQ